MIPRTSPCFCVPDTFGSEADIIMTSFPNHLQPQVSNCWCSRLLTLLTSHTWPQQAPVFFLFFVLLFVLCHFSSETNCCLIFKLPSQAWLHAVVWNISLLLADWWSVLGLVGEFGGYYRQGGLQTVFITNFPCARQGFYTPKHSVRMHNLTPGP